MKGNCVIIFFRSLQNLILVNIKKTQNDIYKFKKKLRKKTKQNKTEIKCFSKNPNQFEFFLSKTHLNI